MTRVPGGRSNSDAPGRRVHTHSSCRLAGVPSDILRGGKDRSLPPAPTKQVSKVRTATGFLCLGLNHVSAHLPHHYGDEQIYMTNSRCKTSQFMESHYEGGRIWRRCSGYYPDMIKIRFPKLGLLETVYWYSIKEYYAIIKIMKWSSLYEHSGRGEGMCQSCLYMNRKQQKETVKWLIPGNEIGWQWEVRLTRFGFCAFVPHEFLPTDTTL